MDDGHNHGDAHDNRHDDRRDDHRRRTHLGREGGRHHPVRFAIYSVLALIIGAVIAGGVWWAYYNFYARFRPVTIAKNQAEIQKLLDQADWVSPGRTGPALYMITWRACDMCTAYQREEFPKLAAAGVDTRVIVYALPDREGLAQSTALERSTVAELWINRSWPLYANWMGTPRKQWTAPGVRPSDASWARNAVVGSTRLWVDQMTPLLKGAGVGDGSPILIWRDRDGYLKACACSDRRSWHFIREDMGAPDQAPLVPVKVEPIPAPIPPSPPVLEPVPPAPAEPAPVTLTPDPQPQLPAQAAPSTAKAPPAPQAAAKPQGRPKPKSDPKSVFY